MRLCATAPEFITIYQNLLLLMRQNCYIPWHFFFFF